MSNKGCAETSASHPVLLREYLAIPFWERSPPLQGSWLEHKTEMRGTMKGKVLGLKNVAQPLCCIVAPFRKSVQNIHCSGKKDWEYLCGFSKHRPSVCLCVCSLVRYRLNVFLPPLPEVGCSIFLEIRNPWGKVLERSGLTFEHFCLEVV